MWWKVTLLQLVCFRSIFNQKGRERYQHSDAWTFYTSDAHAQSARSKRTGHNSVLYFWTGFSNHVAINPSLREELLYSDYTFEGHRRDPASRRVLLQLHEVAYEAISLPPQCARPSF